MKRYELSVSILGHLRLNGHRERERVDKSPAGSVWTAEHHSYILFTIYYVAINIKYRRTTGCAGCPPGRKGITGGYEGGDWPFNSG